MKLNSFGRSYYDVHPLDLVVHVGARAVMDKGGAPTGAHWEPRRMPLAMEDLQPYFQTPLIDHEGHVLPSAALQAAVEAAVAGYIDQLPTNSDGDHIMEAESSCYWVYDEDLSITFTERIAVGNGRSMHIENIPDRPLLGIPVIPPDLYRKDGLCKIACKDLKDEGGCVFAQMLLCQQRKQVWVDRVSKRVNGKMTTTSGTRVDMQKPVFSTPEKLSSLLQTIWERQYPLALANNVPEGEEPKRPYPYEDGDWRTVGVTTRMVAELCEQLKIRMTVLWKNNVIYQLTPEGTNKDSPHVYFAIWGDHAFFYDDGDAKRGAALLPAPPADCHPCM
jgi:hypothetical protein